MSRNIREQINLKTLIKITDALEIDAISELIAIENFEKDAYRCGSIFVKCFSSP